MTEPRTAKKKRKGRLPLPKGSRNPNRAATTGHKFPSVRYEEFCGELQYRKGTMGTRQLILSFDTVPSCERERCPVAHLCTYEWAALPENSPCSTLQSYVRGVVEVLYKMAEEYECEDKEVLDIGLALLPQYLYLGKLQLLELGVRMGEAVTVTNNGRLSFHPVYGEIRSTQKAIESAWRGLGYESKGIGGKRRRGSGMRSAAAALKQQSPVVDTTLHGDPDYYEALGGADMEGDEEEEENKDG